MAATKSRESAKTRHHEAAAERATVAECLVWPTPNSPVENTGSTAARQFSDTQENKHDCPTVPAHVHDSETAGEALRGWPRHRRLQEQCKENEKPRSQPLGARSQCQKTESQKPRSANTKNRRKNGLKEDSDDVYIGDLLSQKYLQDHLEKNAANRKDNDTSAKQSQQNVILTKANKTTQLRSIAIASKLNPEQAELWKMPKFTKNIQPQVKTHGAANSKQSTGKPTGEYLEENELQSWCANGNMVNKCNENYSYDQLQVEEIYG